MSPYLDAGFVLTLLVHTGDTPRANTVLRRLAAPFELNFLHQLQVENFLVSLQKTEELDRFRAGNEGLRTWRHYLAEGVFRLVPTDWDSAFRVAINWNSQHSRVPSAPLLLLHPSLAAVTGATHFLSFDSRSRAVARAGGLTVLPERIY